MKLSNFENEVEPEILNRGLEYYRRNKLKKVLKKDDTYFEFEVAGSNNYIVTVNFEEDGDTLIETSCTCPYDQGLICKHQVTAFFYLLENKVETEKGTVYGNLRLSLSRLYKNELIEILMEQAAKYPAERKTMLSRFIDFRLHPDLRYLKMAFVDTIKSYLFAGHQLGSYELMDLTDDLAQITDIARKIEEDETYINTLFVFYTEALAIKTFTSDTLGSIDALLQYILYDLKQRLSQISRETQTEKLKLIISLDLTLAHDIYSDFMAEGILLASAFKDHLEEEDARKQFLFLLRTKMSHCITTGDEQHHAELLELKSYVERWYGE